jgi:hypothetical protein
VPSKFIFFIFKKIVAAFFYNVVVSWSIWYVAATLLGMDWEHCGHWYNTDTYLSVFCKVEGILLDLHSYLFTKWVNVFCFLSSLPFLPSATTAVFGSYLHYRWCGLAYPYVGRGFVRAKKKKRVGPLSI